MKHVARVVALAAKKSDNVQHMSGPILVVWLTIIFLAARVDLMFADRIQRTWRRARTYLALRRDSRFRAQVLQEIDALLADALHLEQSLIGSLR